MIANDPSRPPPLEPRDPAGHKGTFGTVAVIGGCGSMSTPMIGAPTLAARAALRAGCGLVRLVMPETIIREGILLCPSATGFGFSVDHDSLPSDRQAIADHVRHADSIVIGPGLGPDLAPAAPIARLVAEVVALGKPTVIDADALNALSSSGLFDTVDLSRSILTPHPGEFARIARSLGLQHQPADADARLSAAAELANRLKCVVVLKGAGTVVSDGDQAWVCDRGHHCMATAGTGDVLSGLTGSLFAQNLRTHSHYEIARQSVWSHAAAGEQWAEDHDGMAGMLAAELADRLPGSLAQLGVRGDAEPPTRRA